MTDVIIGQRWREKQSGKIVEVRQTMKDYYDTRLVAFIFIEKGVSKKNNFCFIGSFLENFELIKKSRCED